MRKKLLLCFIVAIALTGCSTTADLETDQTEAMESKEIERKETWNLEESKEDTTEAKSQETSLVNGFEVTFYLPNEAADSFIEEQGTIPELTAESLQSALNEKLNLGDVRVNSFMTTVDDEDLKIDLDLSEEFSLREMGTSQEYMVLGSLVNTYLMAFHADEILITINGETLQSGHSEYTEYLNYFETNE